MGGFASTVAYYENARPPYGVAFFEAVAQQLGFDRSQRLLDVGDGPGILAIGFAPYCREVASVEARAELFERTQRSHAAPVLNLRRPDTGKRAAFIRRRAILGQIL